MKIHTKDIILGACLTIIFLFTGCEKSTTQIEASKYPDTTIIELNNNTALMDGKSVEEFDYSWNCDPSVFHNEVENAPAEFYTGTKPDTEAPVYIDHELYYYPLLDENGFIEISYDGEREWAYYYTNGVNDDFIFATLPNLQHDLPVEMMHSSEEAAENKVLHIVKPGTYVLVGEWKGQINIDLGQDAQKDEEAVVTLIMDGVNIVCSVAPGIVFQNVYECDYAWKDVERTDASIDTAKAGAKLIIADGSENSISGENVYRMLKTKYKDTESQTMNGQNSVKLQKKMRKLDGALYSYMTMNIDGENKGDGQLIVTSSFEGIGSELHLNIRGGNITISAQDDGINVNEDHMSVAVFSGGETTISAALGAEGDGVDSNGYILVDGGNINVSGIRVPDSALDAEDGIYYNSGVVIVDGNEQSYEPNSVINETWDKRGPGQGFEDKFDWKDGEKFSPEGEGMPRPEGEGMPSPDGEKMPRPDGERMPRPNDGRMPKKEFGQEKNDDELEEP